MKIITIAMFLVLIQIAAGMLNAIGFTEGYKYQPDEESLQDIQSNVEGEEYLQNVAAEDTTISFGFGDFFRGIYIFVKSIFWAVVSVRGTIESLACGNAACATAVSEMARYISYAVYLVWGLALAQFISNRASKGMA